MFVPENGTFSEMLAWPTSEPALEAMMAETASGQPADRWYRHVGAALELLRDRALAGVQVKVAVEIQLTFDSFAAVRNAVHLNYDMVRPSKCVDLWANFGGLEKVRDSIFFYKNQPKMFRATVLGRRVLTRSAHVSSGGSRAAPARHTALPAPAGGMRALATVGVGGGQRPLPEDNGGGTMKVVSVIF
eukprot:gene10889-6942_t